MPIFTNAKRQPEKPPVMNFTPPEENYQVKILAFSGKLEAGKDSASNLISGLALCHVVRGPDGKTIGRSFEIDADGKLLVDFGNGLEFFDMESRNPTEHHWMIWPLLKVYSFATPLKAFCNTVLGVSEECLWGSHEQKDGLTHIKWADLPGNYKEMQKKAKDGVYLTGREVQEYFGTNVIRKMYGDAWAKGLMHIVCKENPVYAIIKDARFVNEVAAVEEGGGDVIRLTRATEKALANTHISNTELDNHSFKYVLDNQNQDRMDTFNDLVGLLVELGWFSVVSQ